MNAAQNTQTLADIIDSTETSMKVVSKKEIPPHITDNLNPNFIIRPYQQVALKRFLFYIEDYHDRPNPSHILFEMATGSGKTLIMAALMLDLYQRGYRNFMFFVNATNIIEKTKANFLDMGAAKYLFAERIVIDGRKITIRMVDNFDEANPDDINIHFTTIQGLHTRLNKPSENAVTYEDFADRKIVMLSDEAHHINTLTKKTLKKDEKENRKSWENTVQRIFHSGKENYLLEFTATAGLENLNVAEKYSDKILYQYDLKKFRIDGYSKEVDVLQADMTPLKRAFQAIVLSQYRRKIAEQNKIQIKPVILMKSRKIPDSEKIQEDFHAYIDNLTPEEINKIADGAKGVVKIAFDFFMQSKNITPENLIRELQQDFSREKCLSINSKGDSESLQIQVNTLENRNNETRVIFVVDMLNEGWDVLNLFDIVRLYETRDAKDGKPGTTTIKEAQLIGRGARYCPFVSPEEGKADEPKDMRKYDDTDHELRFLETLYYHCARSPRYINEIKQALAKSGIIPDDTVQKQLKVKKSFKKTTFYKKHAIYVNERITNTRDDMLVIKDYLKDGLAFDYGTLPSGEISIEGVFDSGESKATYHGHIKAMELKLTDFPSAVLYAAIDRSPFFHFVSLCRYFPKMKKMDVGNFLKGVKVTVRGEPEQVDAPSAQTQLEIALFALGEIEQRIKGNAHEHKGTKTFKPKLVKEIVRDKTRKFSIEAGGEKETGVSWKDTKIAGLGHIDLFTKDWFVYEDNFGTSEEKHLIGYISDHAEKIKNEYDEFYLIRNEGGFKLYTFEDGKVMEPDFLLCARKNGSKQSTMHQIFIEPKGTHIADGDRWKEDFLKAIETEAETAAAKIHGHRYILVGMPFYNKKQQTGFSEAFTEKLGL